jgi:hypothetical protein
MKGGARLTPTGDGDGAVEKVESATASIEIRWTECTNPQMPEMASTSRLRIWVGGVMVLNQVMMTLGEGSQSSAAAAAP